jgi:GT2 family glycosyltransferase
LALEYATGDFVAFLDHDDSIEPDAIERVVEAISQHDDVDVLYTDEDKLDVDGSFVEAYHKPGWSPEHLHSVMYVLHLLVIRKSVLLALGGLRGKFSGAQDYDLALRATKIARRVVSIPKILYHWRKTSGSAAAKLDAKPQALVNARLALEDAVKEIEPKGLVLQGLLPGTFRVQWPIPSETVVTLLIPTNAGTGSVLNRGRILFVRNLLESITSKSTWKKYKVLVVDNNNLSVDQCRHIEGLGGRVAHYSFEGKFNFSKKMNFAFGKVDTEQVILLNDDTEIISSDWIEALLSFSTRESIGAVGARLLYPNDRVQHSGIVIDGNCQCKHIFHNIGKDEIGYCGYTHLIRNYIAVTGAAMATRMSLVRMLGGFREEFGLDYNDVDYCLRLREKGYRSVFTPFASLYHFEGASTKRSIADERETALFKSLWQKKIAVSSFFRL